MRNAFVRFGRKCVYMAIGGGLMAAAAFAGQIHDIKVTLPHAVTVGATTLPSGEYTISSLDMADGSEVFVVRGEHGAVATLLAQKVDAEETKRTEVVFSTEGDSWRFDKLFIAGDTAGYEFEGR